MEGLALIPDSPTLALISHECIYSYWFSPERDWPLPIAILEQLLGSCTMDRILNIHCLSLSLSFRLFIRVLTYMNSGIMLFVGLSFTLLFR
jgi:hypothetical protein